MDSPAPRVAASRPARRQTPARARRLRWMIFGVPAFLICILLLLVGVRWWLDRFLRSEDFRRFLDREASAALQAEAHIEPLHWDGSELFTAGVEVRGTPNGPLTAFNADQVRAVFDLNALWRRVWRIETLDLERVAAEVSPDSARKTGPPQPSPDKVAPPGADHSFLASLLPNRMELGEMHIADFSLKWSNDQTDATGRLENARVNARMLGNLKSWEVDGHGGTLSQGKLPPVVLDDFNLKSTEDAVFITRATGRPEPGGKLELSGKQSLSGAKDLDLKLDLDGVPIGPFLPPDWRQRLHGKATGSVHVTGSPEDAKGWQSSGHVELREGRLEALPVLDELALFSSSARYRQTVIQKGGIDFTWSPGQLTVRNLVLESEGLLRVEGDFTVRAQQIDGFFRVGVATSTFRWVDGIGAAVFNLPAQDGYVWTTMRLTGPVNDWHEDLTGRLAASAEQAVARKAREGTDAVLDTASGLLDLLKPH